MGVANPPLTDFQARLLFQLCEEFLNSGPQAGLMYEQMMGKEAIKASSIPMLKKTVRNLRTRTLPLVSSHTESLGNYPKGRRPDVFTIDPTSIVTSPETAYLIFFIYWSLPTDRSERDDKSDVDRIIRLLMVKEYVRKEGPEYVNLEIRGNDLGELEEAALKMFEPDRAEVEIRMIDELNKAHRLGYLLKPVPNEDLQLTPKALSELAYLRLHYEAVDPPYKRPPPSTKPMESGAPPKSTSSKRIGKGPRKAVKPKPKKLPAVARKAVKAKPKRQHVRARK